MKIGIINGPNLNLLGVREKEIYGNTDFLTYLETLKEQFPEVELQYFQSNIEGELIDKLQEWGFDFDGIILNAGGYTHTSVAIGDAIKAITTPVVEVHISNILGREDFRKISHISASASGIISGLGLKGYDMAVYYFQQQTP